MEKTLAIFKKMIPGKQESVHIAEVNDGGINVVQSYKPVDHCDVCVKVVEGVRKPDFDQADRTWRCLEEAGLAPGSLVVNALANPLHGYEVQELHTQEKVDICDKLGESLITADRLIAWKRGEGSVAPRMITAGAEKSLALIERSLVTIEKGGEKVIEISAVVKQTAPPSLESVNIEPVNELSEDKTFLGRDISQFLPLDKKAA